MARTSGGSARAGGTGTGSRSDGSSSGRKTKGGRTPGSFGTRGFTTQSERNRGLSGQTSHSRTGATKASSKSTGTRVKQGTSIWGPPKGHKSTAKPKAAGALNPSGKLSGEGPKKSSINIGRAFDSVGLDTRIAASISTYSGDTLADLQDQQDSHGDMNLSGFTSKGPSNKNKDGGGNKVPKPAPSVLANKGSLLTGPNGEVGKPTDEASLLNKTKRASAARRRVRGVL